MSFLGGLDGKPATDLTFTHEPMGDRANSTRIYAYRNGVRVGVVSVSLYDVKKLPYAAYIQYVYVPEEHRKTGVAIALLRETRKWLRLQKPEIRYLMAKAVWAGSAKMLEDAYGAHLLAHGDARLSPKPPRGSWEGVPDAPGIEYVWWVKVVDKSPGKGLEAVFGEGILNNPRFGELLTRDFTLATQYQKGTRLYSIRAQE